jgi:very-short-patch-repair endonuclease
MKKRGRKNLTTESFIDKARSIHFGRFNYSHVNYIDSKTKVDIICNSCGNMFQQRPQDHLHGYGCPYCAGKKLTTDDFINRSVEIHCDKYDYSRVKYTKATDKVCIKCNDCCYTFFTTPHDFLRCRGCPRCASSKLERSIEKYLTDNNIFYVKQQRFSWLLSENGYPMKLDFYLPEYKTALECQGKQHFINTPWFDTIEQQQARDNLKFNLCKKHGIKVIYVTNVKLPEYPYEVVRTKNQLKQCLGQ